MITWELNHMRRLAERNAAAGCQVARKHLLGSDPAAWQDIGRDPERPDLQIELVPLYGLDDGQLRVLRWEGRIRAVRRNAAGAVVSQGIDPVFVSSWEDRPGMVRILEDVWPGAEPGRTRNWQAITPETEKAWRENAAVQAQAKRVLEAGA